MSPDPSAALATAHATCLAFQVCRDAPAPVPTWIYALVNPPPAAEPPPSTGGNPP